MSWIKNSFATLRNFFAFDKGNVQSTQRIVTDLNQLKVVELKAMAKARGLKGYTSLKKAQLVELLNQDC